MTERHSVRRSVAIASAVCIWIAALLGVLQAFDVTGSDGTRPDFNQTLWRSLDPKTLRDFWHWKRDQKGTDISITLFGSAGNAGLAYCVLVLKRVFRRYKGGTSDIPAFMAGCFFLGAFLPAVEFLQNLGMTTTADQISAYDGLPDVGIQALHVTYLTTRGLSFYLWSMQFVLISIGLSITSYLSWTTGELSRKHAVLGIITAIFGFLSFIFELVVFNVPNAGTGYTFGITLLLHGFILLPIWTIWLGIELKRLKSEQSSDTSEGMDVKLSER
jgi:hypothetical protein